VRFAAHTSRIRAGYSLEVLAVWKARGPAHAWRTRLLLEPEAGGEPEPFPREEDFPSGLQAVHLHNLGPPGLLWGDRPLGSGLAEPHRLRQGQLLADAFPVAVPRHLVPGRYRLRLELSRHGKVETPDNQVAWPIIEVEN
jgi:hypothetical protein